METFTTNQVAMMIGIHPNTVRLYEKWGLIPTVERNHNGYRIYTSFHVEVLKVARLAFQVELTQSGLRQEIIQTIKHLANQRFTLANESITRYIRILDEETNCAVEAIGLAGKMLIKSSEDTETLSRQETSALLGVSVDSLRNWEMNGLIKVRRLDNGYRVYTQEEIRKLKIIRTLRFANYSLSSILRLVNQLDQSSSNDHIKEILNTPDIDDDIISVCDCLLVSLEKAKINGCEVKQTIEKLETLHYTTNV